MAEAPEVVDLFLCHTGADKEWVRSLADRLERELVDGRQLRVFFDEWDIAPGENILTRIEEGLRRARFIAVALSPALIRASWPTLEWQSQVYDDPSGKRGRIIPLLVRKHDPETLEPIDIPYALRILRYVDFSDTARFAQSYDLLLSRIRGQRPARGRPSAAEASGTLGFILGPEAADPVEEVLLGNLFPAELPAVFYSDLTTAERYSDVWKQITGPLRVPFVLHAGRLFSFMPLEEPDSPFKSVVGGADRRTHPVEEWLSDTDGRKRLAWLCNDALHERCYTLRIRSPRGERFQFYPPAFGGNPRVFSWGSGRAITLAKVSTTGTKPLGVHRSARMRFIEIAGAFYLLIEPGWFFTSDGVTPLEGRQLGILSVKWGGREGNDTVLRHTLMWARLLAAGQTTIALPAGGSVAVKVAPAPVHGRANLGIAIDSVALAHLLDGTGAGEVLDEAELDRVAAAVESGGVEEEDEGLAGVEDDVEDERRTEDASGSLPPRDELELPF